MRNRRVVILNLLPVYAVLLLSSPLFSQELLEEVARLDINFGSGTYIHEVFSDGNLLFTLVGGWDPESLSVGIFDVADPESPMELGRIEGSTYKGDPEYGGRVTYLNNTEFHYPTYAVLSDNGNNLLHYFWYPSRSVVHNGFIYEFRSYSQEVRIYTAELPTEISLVITDTLKTDMGEISGIAMLDEVIYITTRSGGLTILDISDPDSLVEVESPITHKNLTGFVVGDGMALVGEDFSNIVVLDVSDPLKPTVEFTKLFGHHRLLGIWANDQFYMRGLEGISILTRDLEIKYEIPTKGYVSSFTLHDVNLVASTILGIEMYDISDESDPILQSVYGANVAFPVQFHKKDDLLYVANLGDGLKMVDVTDSHQPMVIGQNDFNGYARDVKVLGNYAYIADYVNGLIIVDVSQPENPQITSTLPLEGGAVALDLREEEAFIITDKNELYIVNISVKQQPEIVFEKAIHPYYEMRFGNNKRIIIAHSYIWVKFSGYPLYAYEYSLESGLREIFRYEYNYSSEPYEIKSIDTLLFFVNFNGIQIIDLNSLSFIREEVFGSAHMEESPVAVAFDNNSNVLYVSMMVFGISGIKAFDIETPETPERLEGYLRLWFAPREMIFEDGLLYILTPEGVGIYSPSITIDVRDTKVVDIPINYGLHQNYPNPFNPQTTIEFTIPQSGFVNLTIYDILGRKVETILNQHMQAGHHKLQWKASNVPSGIHFIRMRSGDFSQTRKVVVLP